MANQRLVDLLGQYTGELDSLTAFVTAAEEELGADWTQTIYADMEGVSDDTRERLDHAFNYYAATTAWNELQSYLMQETPLDYQETLERVPVLEHWLSFFGAVGEDAVAQLKEKLRHQGQATHQNTTPLDNPFAQEQAVSPATEAGIQVSQEQINHIFSEEQPSEPVQSENLPDAAEITKQSLSSHQTETVQEVVGDTSAQRTETVEERAVLSSTTDVLSEKTPVLSGGMEHESLSEETGEIPPETYRTDVFDPIAAEAPAQNKTPLQAESEESWRARRMFRQVDFVSNVEAWISFLCLELGYTDFYMYRHYGFLVDVLDKTIAELKEVLAQVDSYELINTIRPNGVKFLQDKLIAYEQQAKEGHEMLSDYEPLMPLTVDDLKDKLGLMDLSGEKEYLGPAPDGFEMIDDPYENMNDDELKKEYEKIEAQGNLSPENAAQPTQNVAASATDREKQSGAVKNTSQTSQNGVQRKMSFTFGSKPTQNPTQTGGDAS